MLARMCARGSACACARACARVGECVRACVRMRTRVSAPSCVRACFFTCVCAFLGWGWGWGWGGWGWVGLGGRLATFCEDEGGPRVAAQRREGAVPRRRLLCRRAVLPAGRRRKVEGLHRPPHPAHRASLQGLTAQREPGGDCGRVSSTISAGGRTGSNGQPQHLLVGSRNYISEGKSIRTRRVGAAVAGGAGFWRRSATFKPTGSLPHALEQGGAGCGSG
jgi:hypothetical protein